MAYTYHRIVCGRVASECMDGDAYHALAAMAEELPPGKADLVTLHASHDEGDASLSVGVDLGRVDPWGRTDASRLRLVPTAEEAALAEEMLATLPEPLRSGMAGLPRGVWLVATGA